MAEPVIVNLNFGGSPFTFYDFVGSVSVTEFQRRIEELRPYFNRVPPTHLSAVAGAKFFIVTSVPGGVSPGGAYYRPAQIRIWLGRANVTGVEDQWLGPYERGSRPRDRTPKHPQGLIAVTAGRFNSGVNTYKFTFLHEFAHMIDFARGFTTNPRYGLNLHTLRGVRYGGFDREGHYRHSTSVGEYFAEAYSRWIINGNNICRTASTDRRDRILPSTIPEGETQRTCSARLRRVLESL